MCQCLKSLQRRMAYERLSMDAPLESCTFESFSLEYYQEDERVYRQMEKVFRACQKLWGKTAARLSQHAVPRRNRPGKNPPVPGHCGKGH